jgi:hypothetical protein
MNSLKKTIATMLIVALPLVGVGSTQNAAQSASSAAKSEEPSDITAPIKAVLKDGTEVKLTFNQNLSSKTARVGDIVEFLLDEDLKAADVVVVRKGARAVGTITQVKKSGTVGRGGELSLQLDYLMAKETKIRLRGAHGGQGQNKEGAVIGLTLAFGVVGFLKHGKQLEIKQGTPAKGFVDRDTEVTL